MHKCRQNHSSCILRKVGILSLVILPEYCTILSKQQSECYLDLKERCHSVCSISKGLIQSPLKSAGIFPLISGDFGLSSERAFGNIDQRIQLQYICGSSFSMIGTKVYSLYFFSDLKKIHFVQSYIQNLMMLLLRLMTFHYILHFTSSGIIEPNSKIKQRCLSQENNQLTLLNRRHQTFFILLLPLPARKRIGWKN